MARGPLKMFTRQVYPERALRIYQGTCGEIVNRVRERTPVDTGELRDSWDENHSPSELTLNRTYRVKNEKPYARPIEYNGHSPQAPRGMMRPTLAEFNQIVMQQVRKHAA